MCIPSQVMWHAAAAYARRLRAAAGLEPAQLEARVRQIAAARELAQAAAAAAKQQQQQRPMPRPARPDAQQQQRTPPGPKLIIRQRSSHEAAAAAGEARSSAAKAAAVAGRGTGAAPRPGKRLRRLSQQRLQDTAGEEGATRDAGLADDELQLGGGRSCMLPECH